MLLAVKRSFAILKVDEESAFLYSEITRKLRKKGQLMGTNDLWIAANAIQHNLPLVTKNKNHFSRVPNLKLKVY